LTVKLSLSHMGCRSIYLMYLLSEIEYKINERKKYLPSEG
jgi:hypothetical protein